MGGFGDHFGINTYSYTQSMSAADCLRHLADKGVRTIELMFYPGHVWISNETATMREIASVIEDRGLDLVSMNTPNIDLNIAAATEGMRALSLGINRSFLQLSSELGATGLVLGPGKPNPLFPLPADVLEGHFFKALDVLVPIAESTGVALFVENMPFAFLPAADDVMGSLARYGHDGIKVCYDIANAHFISEDPAAGLKTVASRLALVHASDTTRAVYRHDAVGAGDIDFSPLPAALTAAGYERPVILEVISNDADADIDRSITALRQAGL